jgi:MATE family multidrug resistance protein
MPAADKTTALREVRALAVIALPLAGAYLAEVAMVIITKIIAGKLGHLELAAVGLAGDLVFEVMMVLAGLLSVVGVLAAEAEGAGDPQATALAARQGILVATALGLPGTLAIWYMGGLLPLLGQDAEVVALASLALKALAPALLPVLWFTVLRNFVAAVGHTRSVLVITLLAVGLDALLSYGLVLGRFGLPAWGVVGAGLALSLTNWFMFTALLAVVLVSRRFASYRLWRGLFRADRPTIIAILRLGFPVALIVLLESGLFSAVQLLMGLFGALALAANQIVISWAACAFVIVLGLSEATMVRVARASGGRRGDLARQAGLIGIALSVGIMLALALVPLTLPDALSALFLDPGDLAAAEVTHLATALLLIAAVFGVFDGLQAVATRALRGLRDTVVPIWFAAFGYWGVGIGGGAVLAFPLGMGEEGLWWGLAGGLMVTGVALTWRFVLRTSPRRERRAAFP